jgi:hypothetical protein
MNRVCRFCLVPLLATVLGPFPTHAEGGYYTFSVSTSSVDPFVNNPPNPGAGLQFLYLWSLDACNPTDDDPGWSAAEFKVKTPAGTGWEILAFNQAPGFIDIAPAPDETGKNFQILGPYETTCGPGFFLMGEFVVMADDGPGTLEFGSSDCPQCSEKAVAVNCSQTVPQAWPWPTFIRFIGFATQDAGANQDAGSGCGVVPVESESWGRIKSLYEKGR